MTALMVELCACGHSPRMHSLDDEAGRGRGECAHRSCDCSAYEPESVETVVPDEPLAPVEVEAVEQDVEAPRVVAIAPASSAASFPCPLCGKEFTTAQGRGGHRAKAHPGSMTTQTAAVADARPVAPDQPHEAGAAAVPPQAVAAPTSTPVEVDPDVVLVGLVRALDGVVDGTAVELVEMALDIRRYMTARGWRVLDGGPR